ncbi:MAG: AbiV family abortive infection protein [Thaumarchaeota archaeon]|nr:AbiV family abortive infection protein [Nitrososphaerota archaeon]
MADPNTDYRTISRLAYDNGVDLYEEAKLLHQKESPRAFTLAVASIEELEKSQLCDLVAKGMVKPEELVFEDKNGKHPLLTHHKGKQILFTLFLLTQAANKEGRAKVAEVYDTLMRTGNTDTVNVKGKKQIVEQIVSMESRRQDSVYVGTKGVGKQVKSPKKAISRKMAEYLLQRISEYLPKLKTNLMMSDQQYQAENEKRMKEYAKHVQPVNTPKKSEEQA